MNIRFDIHFKDIPIYTHNDMPNDRIVVMDKKSGDQRIAWLQREYETPEEKTAREVADRLLGHRGGALTFELLQNAVDALAGDINKRVFDRVILMSPEIRREYMKLIDAD
jgi:hypothetical protein